MFVIIKNIYHLTHLFHIPDIFIHISLYMHTYICIHIIYPHIYKLLIHATGVVESQKFYAK